MLWSIGIKVIETLLTRHKCRNVNDKFRCHFMDKIVYNPWLKTDSLAPDSVFDVVHFLDMEII